MAKREAVCCDFIRGDIKGDLAVIRPTACNKLSDGECAVCNQDGCEDHLSFKLTLKLFTDSPLIPGPEPRQPLLPHTYRDVVLRICGGCQRLFFNKFNKSEDPTTSIKEKLGACIAACIDDMKAQRATEALK